jgi:hypothetical protein
MTKDQIGGVVRAILAGGVGWAINKGLIPAGDYADLLTGLTLAAVAVWSAWTNRPANIAAPAKP